VIDLGYVTSSGYQNAAAGINCYCGILYAQPPLGNLRWREPCPIETSNNFGGQSTNATKVGGHTQNYTDLWRKLNADQTGCRMGHGRQRSLLAPGRRNSEWQYCMAPRMSSCSDLNYLRPLPSEALANLNQAGQNASYLGLRTVMASSSMDSRSLVGCINYTQR
jgi:hypothetical protein